MAFSCEDLDQFLNEYGDLLAAKARETLAPLHVPGRDTVDLPSLYRKAFDAQGHVAEAVAKQWKRAKACLMVAEMGTGKTFMSMAAAHAHLSRQASFTEMGRKVLRSDPGRTLRGEALEFVEVDPFTADLIHQSRCRAHDDKKAGVKTFDFGGEMWASNGGGYFGTPGSAPAYSNEYTCYRVIPADQWKAPVSTFEDVYNVSGNKDRNAKMARVAMGGLGISGTMKKKPVVLHSPKVFVSRCARPYRVAVICPGQLVEKWTREIVNTVPGAIVYQVENYAQILRLARQHAEYKTERQRQEEVKKEFNRVQAKKEAGETLTYPEEMNYGSPYSHRADSFSRESAKCRTGNMPKGPEYYIIGRDCLKLSCGWKPVYRTRRGRPGCYCPKCGMAIVKPGDKAEPATPEFFMKKGKPTSRRKCVNKVRVYRSAADQVGHMVECGEQLWTETDKPKKYSPARIIQKKLKGFFDIGVIDEAHEYKSGESLQGDAIGAISGSCKKIAALTGTLVGGYAWHVRTLLFRIGGAAGLVAEGLGWKDETEFNRRFGRIETKTVISRNAEQEKGHLHGRGGKKAGGKTTTYVRPGIMPTLFSHLLGQSVFLGLGEVADNLPDYFETPVAVEMDDEQRGAYDVVDKALTEAIRDMVRTGNKRMLGTMLNCLLCYPDYAYDWGEIGYYEDDESSLDSEAKKWVHVVTPANLDPTVIRPKEQEAVDYALDQRAKGRQTWIYVCYTDKRDCIARLERFLKAAGLRVGVMRASVPPKERERWIEANGPKYDVVLSHPQLVQTGLDFFSPKGTHNFCSILFYQTGYNLFTLMQAARRAWRIGQMKVCEVRFLYYAESMQARAMALMGKKMMCARNLNGQFSAEGLAAMAGEDAGLEMELAKSLAEAMPEGQQIRSWAKVSAARPRQPMPKDEDDAAGDLDVGDEEADLSGLADLEDLYDETEMLSALDGD
jgi:hypothetical protein